MASKPLIINNWVDAIADSPVVGPGLVRNASIDAVTGALQPNLAPSKISPTSSSSTFTANAGTDVCDIGGGTFAAMQSGVAVTFSSTGTLPAGLVAGTIYFLIKVTTTTFKVATNYGNSATSTAIDITDAGTGTHTVATVNPGTMQSVAVFYETSTLVAGSPARITFYADSNGRVWFYDPTVDTTLLVLLPGNTLTNGNGRGLATFKTAGTTSYLFTFRGAKVDVCDISTQAKRWDPVGLTTWSNDWQSLTGASTQTTESRHAILGQDNIVYYCDGMNVGSIAEVAGQTFLPSNSATYTFNGSALDLPKAEIATWLEELGVNLLIAGSTYNKIYPWDRTSASFDIPIACAESQVYRLKNINNTVYILAGNRGNIYRTQGAVVTLAKKLPEHVVGTATSTSTGTVAWGGVGAKSGNLIFGVTANNNSANSGIYSLLPDGRLVIENQPSGGAGAVGAIEPDTDEFYTFGYVGGVDVISTSRRGSFGTVFQSELYKVATKTGKGAYTELEVQINKPTTGTSSQVRVSYRTNLSASFTTIATFTTDAAATSFSQDVGGYLTNLENLQIQVELTGAGNNAEALELLEVRLYP